MYMDSCTLENDFGVTNGGIKTNKDGWTGDAYLYVSNTKFTGTIRVDGPNNWYGDELTGVGYLYIGKNVEYASIGNYGTDNTGEVDTETYKDTEFLH